jgi:hypothetical protein
MKHLIILAVVFLSGCDDTPSLTSNADALAKLSPAGQVAAFMQIPAMILATAIVINGFIVNKTKTIIKNAMKKDEP